MLAVIFEVYPSAEGKEEYLQIAAQLRNFLQDRDGLISIERFQSLAGCVVGVRLAGPEQTIVSQHLRRLAELIALQQVRSPEQYIEQIRDLADRIQEPAGNRARHRRVRS